MKSRSQTSNRNTTITPMRNIQGIWFKCGSGSTTGFDVLFETVALVAVAVEIMNVVAGVVAVAADVAVVVDGLFKTQFLRHSGTSAHSFLWQDGQFLESPGLLQDLQLHLVHFLPSSWYCPSLQPHTTLLLKEQFFITTSKRPHAPHLKQAPIVLFIEVNLFSPHFSHLFGAAVSLQLPDL